MTRTPSTVMPDVHLLRSVLPRVLATLLVLACLAPTDAKAADVPPPESVLGFAPCSDYKLATWERIDEYLQALDRASDRMTMVEIGRSVDGRPLRLAIISSERNLAALDRYRAVSAQLAQVRGPDGPLDDETARALAREGRAVVWVDFGLHSSEVAHGQAAPLFAWRMVTGETEEIRRIRDDVILLLMPNMNPDGTTLVADWYMRHVGTPYEKSPPPELYHRYVGHDNNRDWFMLTQPESQAVARQLYEVWFPQILHNQHQEAPFPARIFVPPFEDPVNPEIPPLVVRGIATVGSAITRRLEREGKRGAVSRLQFDAWWNGGMRTAPYFHNMIGILTETAHASATPATYDPATFPDTFPNGVSTRVPSADYPSPYEGGRWTQRDSCEYMLTASMAVLDVASRHREEWLYDIYRMGRDAIRAGAGEAFLVPPSQWDPPAATTLVETLRRGGVAIEEATQPFEAGGRRFDAGTYVIRGAQPFRAYIRDLLLPQRYPERRLSPGGPVDQPYDITGWTLPLQMGVDVVRVTELGEIATRPVAEALPRPTPFDEQAPILAIDPRRNAATRLVNRLLAAGVAVERATAPLKAGESEWPAGSFLVRATPQAVAIAREAAHRLGAAVQGLPRRPEVTRVPVRQPRVGLYRPWGGNMDEGWTRFVLEMHEFPLVTLRDADIQAGRLADRVDVVILPDAGYDALLHGHPPGTMPDEYTGGLGPAGIAALHAFVRDGGVLVALDSASELPLNAFALPVRNEVAGLRDTELSVPGSLLRLEVRPDHPLAWGMPSTAAAFFARGLAFGPRPSGSRDRRATFPSSVGVAARYAREDLLLSGWELGGARLQGRAALADVAVGRGRVVLFGFRTQHRAQPHGTFKFLFNALWLAGTPPDERPRTTDEPTAGADEG